MHRICYVIVVALLLLPCFGCGTTVEQKIERELTTIAPIPKLSDAWHPTTWDWKLFEPLNPVQWGMLVTCGGLVAMDDAQTAGFRDQPGAYEGDFITRAFFGSRPKPENREVTAVLVKFSSPMAFASLSRTINKQTNMQAAVPAWEAARRPPAACCRACAPPWRPQTAPRGREAPRRGRGRHRPCRASYPVTR